MPSPGSEQPRRLPSEASDLERPYHTKRPHKKSRAGCQQCKKRKVKCDEKRPTCKACRLRREKCVYPSATASTAVAEVVNDSRLEISSPSPSSQSPSGSSQQALSNALSPGAMVISEPMFRPAEMGDSLDMRMLWFYTTTGFQYFSIQTGRSAVVDHILQVKVVEHAFRSPFLMDCLMAVSAMHLQTWKQPVPVQRAAAYGCKAFQGYRDAIERAYRPDFPALIPASLLMIAMSSQMFREPDAKPLYIIDWMQMWRGIGVIVELISPAVLHESGMAVLFYRPPVDLKKAAMCIPSNLMSMVSSIGPGDADNGYQKIYSDMLKYLGSLYQEMKEHGFNSIFNLRIITFFTFIPKDFMPLAKEHRPRALVILGHYLCFAKLIQDVWWMEGIADRQIEQICEQVGEEWQHLLRVPQMVLKASDRREIAQLLLENRSWTPTEKDPREADRDPRLITEFGLFDNEGNRLSLSHGRWKEIHTKVNNDQNFTIAGE
ncbi:hypothetical protein M426DRAFT_58399 [Hypoxylon sp. CI-4A]|nr:hypothetical protein M426DRAFT_58399 [Hypoxylon sp. CI-4A]